MEKLKVGDKVYHERYHTYGDNVTYIVETVERLTNTQAILSNGVRLINAPYEHNSVVMYSQYGEKIINGIYQQIIFLKNNSKRKKKEYSFMVL